DKATAAYQQGGVASPPAGAFPYSFGHYYCASGVLTCNPNLPFASGGCATQPTCSPGSTNDVDTIMSYFNPVTLKFSNPNLMCAPGGGGGVSQPCGVVNLEDNARSMNNMRSAMQNVKATVVADPPPGAIQFSASSFSAAETAGTVNVTVSRIGASNGAVSVNYATADGTAKAGYDYTAASGTLSWASGDSANKTIAIALINDGVTEGGETFSVSLSSPTGAVGIFMGLPTTASVIIGETWPPGGTLPAGYTTPVSPSGQWATATDFAFEGTTSARSPKVIGTNGTTYSTADMVYTGNFQAGNITFAYRVSSYSSSYGVLDFIIDGNVTPAFTSAGGETGWLTTTIPIAAGAHTITWRYRGRLSFACGSPGVTPPPPGGTNCADRAWVDAVILPLPLSASNVALQASQTPSNAGLPVTFTATVGGAAGTPTGVVTFRDGGIVIPGCNLVAVSAGVALCTTSALTQGSHPINAAYSGSTVYDVSTSGTLSQTVNAGSFLLTVNSNGTGAGSVTSNPAGINTAVADSIEMYAAGTVVTLTAAPQGGSSFAGWSGAGCSGTSTCVVTMIAAATAQATFNIVLTAPGAPTIGAATPGNALATIAFTPPASNGGSPITGYTVTCNVGGFTKSGGASPLTVTGLANNTTYNCSVTASNVIGTSAPSATVPVTPVSNAALSLVSVSSRKTHAGVPYDQPITTGIPIGGLISVEPRAAGAGHSIVFLFNNTVLNPGSVTAVDASTNPIGNAIFATSANPNEVIVNLTGVPDVKRVTVSLSTVTGASNSIGAAASMGFFVGDVSGNRAVNASDISAVKAQFGMPITVGNFVFDLNLSGVIGQPDANLAKARSGFVLP
ncbi:MAG: Calx-beta domain-containing protein, partial [Betaproteobacteria bacterium]